MSRGKRWHTSAIAHCPTHFTDIANFAPRPRRLLSCQGPTEIVPSQENMHIDLQCLSVMVIMPS